MSNIKMRTIKSAYETIKRDDPDTAVSEYQLRKMVSAGIIPSKKSGKKYLVNMADIECYYLGV